jgi:hypothetical protein
MSRVANFWARNCAGMSNNQMRRFESRFTIRDDARALARVTRSRDGEPELA